MRRAFHLTINTWRLYFRAKADAVRAWHEQRTCPHIWQAALVNKHAGRVCKLCDLAQQLSREDFYAQFGERYQAILHVGAPPIMGENKPTMESDTIQ